MTGSSAKPAPAAPATPPAPWDREVDLIVVGAGPAGMTAALVAAREGLEVYLCEKSDHVGGTGAYSAGALWVPANAQGAAAGYADSVIAAQTYFDGLIASDRRRPLRQAFLEAGPAAVDYLNAAGAGLMDAGPLADYQSEAPGAAVGGRVLMPAPFDGRLLGRDFERVRPPLAAFTVLGGMMVSRIDVAHLVRRYKDFASFLYSAKLVMRHLSDRLRYKRGARLVMGNALVARLFHALRGQGVEVTFGASVSQLITADRRVVGAVVSSGATISRIGARRGVVLATGGIGTNRALAERYLPGPADLDLACPTDDGCGLQLGCDAGGRLDAEGQGIGGVWAPTSRNPGASAGRSRFPHFGDLAKPGVIAVTRAGRRFVDESLSYHDIVAAMYATHGSDGCIPAQVIFDARFLRTYGFGPVHPGRRSVGRFVDEGYLARGQTLRELAEAIGVDPANLSETVARHNAFAQSGVDEDFGKGGSRFGRSGGDPQVGPNPCLFPIAQAPFYSVAVWPAPTACGVGLATGPDGEVTDAAGAPIEGLYACGNDMASIMDGVATGPGLTLGPAMVFAYRAAMRAAHPGGQPAPADSTAKPSLESVANP